MSQAALLPEGVSEPAALALLRHLEWQSERFSLIFLFADVGPALGCLQWVKARLVGDSVRQRQAPDSLVNAPQAWLDSLLLEMQDGAFDRGSTWLFVNRHSSDSLWNGARRRLLARLNERRFLLERDWHGCLICLLPPAFREEAQRMAPDLWHVRSFSLTLAAPQSDTPASGSGAVAQGRGAIAAGAEGVAIRGANQAATNLGTGVAYEFEWKRALEQAGQEDRRYVLLLAGPAIDSLLSKGRPADAKAVALQAVSIARKVDEPAGTESAQSADSAHSQRELSRVLDLLGRVARAQGDWPAAESAYRESLEISRQLVQRLGGTPEALRDVSVSLDNVGQVARAQGDWPAAESAYRESLEIRRQLVQRLGGTPEALRDVSVSLNNVGQVARAQGDWPAAESAYRESLEMRRQLVQRLGGTPEALNDVAISLANVAHSPGPDQNAFKAEARAIWEQLIVLAPKVADYRDNLARLVASDNSAPNNTSPKP
jgi:tetratricopeptide (TPR) repeat protein